MPASTSASATRRSSSPAPVRPLTTTAGAPASEVRLDLVARAGQRGRRVGEVGAGHRERRRAARRARRARPGARRPAASTGRRPRRRAGPPAPGPSPASVVDRNRSCPGTSTNATSPTGVEVGPAVAELDREPAPVLLLEAVGVLAGQGPHQGRLAVVDVTRGGDDVHLRPRRPVVRRRRAPSSSVRRHGQQVEQQPVAGDVTDHRRLTGAQRVGERGRQRDRGARQDDAGCAAAADRALGRHGLGEVGRAGRRSPGRGVSRSARPRRRAQRPPAAGDR